MVVSNCSCGGVVLREFLRVFGNPDEEQVYACPVCSDWVAIRNGAAFSEDRDGRVRSWRPGADHPAAIRGRSPSDQSEESDTLDVLLDEVRGELERRYADGQTDYSGNDQQFAAIVMNG